MIVELQNMGTVNQNVVRIVGKHETIDLYFSYETIVAYKNGYTTVARENDWGNTTGKLLNKIEPDKKARITGEEFEKKLERAIKTVVA